MADPIVTVDEGQLKGRVAVDYKGGNYYSFQGIPYAKPPIGKLRFKAPQPAEPWTGVRDALVEGHESVSKHMIFFTDIGDEDCLTLNVYTPQLPSESNKTLKPVMVWIHGGGFTQGSNKTEIYGPEFLITEDVVIISINYRLGILGFLRLDDPALEVPGNAGLKDMVLALKWIQKNVKQFGGDSNNVTIFGESAGAAAVNYLVLSQSAKGLFHRAILQSGCALNPWAHGQNDAFKFAKILGYEGKTEADVLEFFQSVDQQKFLEAQDKIEDPLSVDQTRPMGPVIEKPNPTAFLTESPLEIILSGNYNKVPLLVGYTTREGMFLEFIQKKAYGKIKYPLEDFESAVPEYYNIPKGSNLSKDVAKRIKEFYYGSETPSENDIDKFYLLESDTFFCRGIQVFTKLMLQTLNNPLYFYSFTVESNLNLYKKIGNLTEPGVSHADDLGYLFKSVITPELEEDSLETKSVHRVVTLWTNFAKYGNPNPKEKDPLIDVNWPPMTLDQSYYLDIGKTLSIGTDLDKERMAFWDALSATSGINSKL